MQTAWKQWESQRVISKTTITNHKSGHLRQLHLMTILSVQIPHRQYRRILCLLHCLRPVYFPRYVAFSVAGVVKNSQCLHICKIFVVNLRCHNKAKKYEWSRTSFGKQQWKLYHVHNSILVRRAEWIWKVCIQVQTRCRIE